MMLTPALALTALGTAVWVAGLKLGYKGIATIGAVIVVGIGVSILGGGLEHRVGTVEESINSSHTVISVQTAPVEIVSSFNAGLIWALLGGVMTLQALNFKT